ncbi:MAG: hypothetical protein Q8Q00_01680 [Dehalococcoidia bacterium]|nr:hypothetical protein [Dehalococcoidia bacterium]
MMTRRWSAGPICRRRLRVMAVLAVAALTAVLVAAGAACGGPNGTGGGAGPPQSAAPVEFAGQWRVYSETLFYDAGGSGGSDSGSSTTRELSLHEDGTWEFGSSNGTWYVTAIDAADWSRWGVEDYGPQRKVVLEGWNDDFGDGPIEESEAGVDFLWVIYRVDEPSPGVVQMKFGHP